MMTKFDAIIKMAEIDSKDICKNCKQAMECQGFQSEHCQWHTVRNNTIRRMRMYFHVSPFGHAPRKIFKLANRIADAVVFDGEHFPLVIISSEIGRKSAIRDCRRQFKKLQEKGAYAWDK